MNIELAVTVSETYHGFAQDPIKPPPEQMEGINMKGPKGPMGVEACSWIFAIAITAVCICLFILCVFNCATSEGTTLSFEKGLERGNRVCCYLPFRSLLDTSDPLSNMMEQMTLDEKMEVEYPYSFFGLCFELIRWFCISAKFHQHRVIRTTPNYLVVKENVYYIPSSVLFEFQSYMECKKIVYHIPPSVIVEIQRYLASKRIVYPILASDIVEFRHYLQSKDINYQIQYLVAVEFQSYIESKMNEYLFPPIVAVEIENYVIAKEIAYRFIIR